MADMKLAVPSWQRSRWQCRHRDTAFDKPRLRGRGRFQRVVGNPPFGDEVPEGDEDHLGSNSLASFAVARGRDAVASEHAILERSITFLDRGGRLGLILPDGLFNNQGEISNCPRVRRFLAENGYVEAIVSLPDYAFRKAGAQNKTSILFFRKFTQAEEQAFRTAFNTAMEHDEDESKAIATAWKSLSHRVFLAEANQVGYAPTGVTSPLNDLYRGGSGGQLADDQTGTILGEFRSFLASPATYAGSTKPDCMMIPFDVLWEAHSSHRLDPKYFLFKREEQTITPKGWIREPLKRLMRRRANHEVDPTTSPEQTVVVMTLGQNGEIRPREAGKGRNPPEWRGMYFEDSPSQWFAARAGDVVFSSIDLWKGCISVVPPAFDGALVTKEFPIYEVVDGRLDPEFLSCLLRSRYYQRAFRAITTGHSNRRRTQQEDFEELEVCFPPDQAEQARLIAGIQSARTDQRQVNALLLAKLLEFNDSIDGRGAEQLPEVDAAEQEEQ
ncbi:N-6 DNA methylase [Reyranella soli]|nr:N-6 DNA methylase [Reyranella soli]